MAHILHRSHTRDGLWRKRLGMGRIGPRMTWHIKALSAGLTVRCALMFAVMLIAGCSTQHFESTHSSDAVASCIAKGWEECGASGFKVPVTMEKQTNGYFVGCALQSFYAIPTGTKHSLFPIWAEVNDTNSGSVTTYHRSYQIFHGRIDKAVRNCQEPNECDIPDTNQG
jgi:hypothetical protein